MKWLLLTVLSLQLVAAPLCAANPVCDHTMSNPAGHADDMQHHGGSADHHAAAARPAQTDKICEHCADEAPAQTSLAPCLNAVDTVGATNALALDQIYMVSTISTLTNRLYETDFATLRPQERLVHQDTWLQTRRIRL